jgi:TorA maturation chaperone TorD
MIYLAGMSVNHTFVRDTIQRLADTVAGEADSATRLQTILALDREWRALMIAARDEAAYEMRSVYADADVRRLTGLSSNQIAYWVARHRHRTGAPALGRRTRIDLSRAVDMTAHGAVVGEQPPAVP